MKKQYTDLKKMLWALNKLTTEMLATGDIKPVSVTINKKTDPTTFTVTVED